MVAVTAAADDESLRCQARTIETDLEQLARVDRVDPIGLDDPELQINFDPEALQALEDEAWLVERDAAPARIVRLPLRLLVVWCSRLY